MKKGIRISIKDIALIVLSTAFGVFVTEFYRYLVDTPKLTLVGERIV